MNINAGVRILMVVALMGAGGPGQAGAVEIAEGVLADVESGRVYLMSPQRQVEAVDMGSGKTVWRTDAAAKPLTLSDRVLVSQAEPRPGEATLRLVMLDARDGRPTQTLAEELPGVVVRIDDGLSARFDARAVTVDDASFIAWRSEQVLPRGMPVAEDETDQPPVGPAAAPRRTEGTLRLDVRTGRIARVPRSAVPPAARAAHPMALNAPAGAEADPMQRLSADGRHLLKSELIADDRVWERYQWAIVELASGDTVGTVKSPWSQAGFVVAGGRVIFETPRFQRRVGQDMKSELPAVRAVDLESGKEVWAHDVRDTEYRGPFPP